MQGAKKLKPLVLGWLAVMALLPGPTSAKNDVAPAGFEGILASRLSPLEQRLFEQIRDGRFGAFSLLEAAFIAGGIDRESELHDYCRKFENFVDTLRRSGKVRGMPRERASAVFAFLHQSMLRGGYNLQASDLREAIDRGRFNCVTASVLFNVLTARFELEAVGLEMPGHAMSRLLLPDETLDIETTCPRWFEKLSQAGAAGPLKAGRQSPGQDRSRLVKWS